MIARRAGTGLPPPSADGETTCISANSVRELGDRIVQLEAALLPEHHYSHSRDRLGHGRDAEERIVRHRNGAGNIAPTDGLVDNDTAPFGDDRHGTGDSVLGDFCFQNLSHALVGRSDVDRNL